MKKSKTPTIKQIERAIHLKAEDWPGRCYEVAHLVVTSELVKGHAVYGFYSGPVARSSMFYESAMGAGVVRHGWILLDEDTILDPTRWVFENDEPYVFVTDRHEGHWDEYDEGMNTFKAMLRNPAPSPTDKIPGDVRTKPPMHLPVSRLCDELLTGLFVNGRRKDGRLTNMQLFWLANMPYDLLGEFAPEVYLGLKMLGLSVYIPIDNVKRAQRRTA